VVVGIELPDLSGIDWPRLKIAIVGGDEREREIARLAAATGAKVAIFGFPVPDAGIPDAEQADTPQQALAGADFILFPIPGMSEDGALFAAERIVPDKDMLAVAKPGAHIIMGLPNDNLVQTAKELGLGLHEYETDKELMMLRMPAIVEQAIKLIVENTDVTIHDARIVVVGQGNIGVLLAQRLIALGGHVCVAARNPIQRAQAYAYGAASVSTDQLAGAVSDCDICVSSVPARIVTPDVIDRLPKTALLMDMSAPPGGVDLDYAKSLGIKTVWGRGLGKRAPVTVGASQWKGIAERVIAIMEEKRES
jgi:dipicolinate synthase subunit A